MCSMRELNTKQTAEGVLSHDATVEKHSAENRVETVHISEPLTNVISIGIIIKLLNGFDTRG